LLSNHPCFYSIILPYSPLFRSLYPKDQLCVGAVGASLCPKDQLCAGAVCGLWVVGALCGCAVCGVRLSVGPFKFDGIFLNFVVSFI
jgi:hypothetical protein